MTRNNSKYKCCMSCNNENGADGGGGGGYWKYGNKIWKDKKGRKKSVHFSYPTTNKNIYCSYLMIANEYYMDEWQEDVDRNKGTDIISISHFDILK